MRRDKLIKEIHNLSLKEELKLGEKYLIDKIKEMKPHLLENNLNDIIEGLDSTNMNKNIDTIIERLSEIDDDTVMELCEVLEFSCDDVHSFKQEVAEILTERDELEVFELTTYEGDDLIDNLYDMLKG